ncbi:MAG: putative glycoside hydrolase family 15 protein [Chloroflexi bacterium]|nr:putative glycoside hydrolase family 15 protein [Chloroflexota bacterium]MBU1746296.1 putative glycoside hydrolase family 15 protein [Chloroflexota bacterium]
MRLIRVQNLVAGLLALVVVGVLACEPATPVPSASPETPRTSAASPRLALWLAKKPELLARPDARYDLVMTAWFEPAEAQAIRSRHNSTLLAGLSHTWIWENPDWQSHLVTVANGGDAHGPLQITQGMVLMVDDNGDGALDRRCSLPGWEGLYAMDPRHPGWRQFILTYYETVARQPQHDGVIVDMVDAYPFCDGAWSGGVPTPIDAAAWVAAQDELLGLIRQRVPSDKWLVANAGRDFPAGSPFPRHLNGYVLENWLGSWGLGLEEGLTSAQRALETTQPPHIVVLAVDTDDSGTVDWARFRTGLAASLLMDNTYFAFDYGSRDHGGVMDWWFPQYYEAALGAPLGPYTSSEGVYRRDFEGGTVLVAALQPATLAFDAPHQDLATGETGTTFTVPPGDGRIFTRVAP